MGVEEEFFWKKIFVLQKFFFKKIFVLQKKNFNSKKKFQKSLFRKKKYFYRTWIWKMLWSKKGAQGSYYWAQKNFNKKKSKLKVWHSFRKNTLNHTSGTKKKRFFFNFIFWEVFLHVVSTYCKLRPSLTKFLYTLLYNGVHYRHVLDRYQNNMAMFIWSPCMYMFSKKKLYFPPFLYLLYTFSPIKSWTMFSALVYYFPPHFIILS